jgi:uncharacterized protein (TIGR02145 family)
MNTSINFIFRNRIIFLMPKIAMFVITTLFFSQCSQRDEFDDGSSLVGISFCPIDDLDILSRTVKVGDSLNFLTPCEDGWSYNWTFPGGTPNESSYKSPWITYNVPGTYSVKRIRTELNPLFGGIADIDVREKFDYVIVTAKLPPTANFTNSSSYPFFEIGEQINFNGQSEGSPTQWDWVFQGATPSSSTIKDPVGIVYNTAGTYDVSLTVTNEDGVNTLLKKDYITILPDCRSVIDRDGNLYQVKEMGGKCWMTENLKTTKYKNGDAITTGLDSTNWVDATTGAYAHVDGDQANNTTYGKLYNGHAIFDSRGLCPSGWHAATQLEWDALIAEQGGESLAGGALRTVTGWASPNTGATNSSGFSALPAGFLSTSGFSYNALNYQAFFWIATTTTTNTAPYILMHNGSSDLFSYDANYTAQGMSCRCVKD